MADMTSLHHTHTGGRGDWAIFGNVTETEVSRINALMDRLWGGISTTLGIEKQTIPTDHYRLVRPWRAILRGEGAVLREADTLWDLLQRIEVAYIGEDLWRLSLDMTRRCRWCSMPVRTDLDKHGLGIIAQVTQLRHAIAVHPVQLAHVRAERARKVAALRAR